jgi:hypothetical protein
LELANGCKDIGISALGGDVEVEVEGLPWIDTSLIAADILGGSCNGMSK